MSEQMERNAYRQLLEGITFYIDKVVSDNKEKTTTARIVSIQEDGSYTIDLDGKQYSNIGTIGGVCTINEMVKVMIPQGQYNNMFILKGGSGSGGGSTSGVTSVNGKSGNVVLTASDIGALPNTTVIPTKTSELQNDSNYVVGTDFSNLEQRVNTNEDNIAMLDSDIEGLNTSVGTLQTDMGSVKTAVKTLQDTYVPNTRKVNGKSLDKDISIDKSDIGLENVGNYKSVSVDVNQELTNVEKQNARNNIGAGISNFSGNYDDLNNKPIIDSELLSTSTNAVQNKVVTDALANKLGVDEPAIEAISDSNGNLILSTYASIMELNENTLTLKSKDETVLATISLPTSTIIWNE